MGETTRDAARRAGVEAETELATRLRAELAVREATATVAARGGAVERAAADEAAPALRARRGRKRDEGVVGLLAVAAMAPAAAVAAAGPLPLPPAEAPDVVAALAALALAVRDPAHERKHILSLDEDDCEAALAGAAPFGAAAARAVASAPDDWLLFSADAAAVRLAAGASGAASWPLDAATVA